jgi:hypothetical protein
MSQLMKTEQICPSFTLLFIRNFVDLVVSVLMRERMFFVRATDSNDNLLWKHPMNMPRNVLPDIWPSLSSIQVDA